MGAFGLPREPHRYLRPTAAASGRPGPGRLIAADFPELSERLLLGMTSSINPAGSHQPLANGNPALVRAADTLGWPAGSRPLGAGNLFVSLS